MHSTLNMLYHEVKDWALVILPVFIPLWIEYRRSVNVANEKRIGR